MKNLLDIIKQRRSVRRYQEAIPSDSDIDKILEAGRWAPSGLNNQPWRFLIIKDKAKKEGLELMAAVALGYLGEDIKAVSRKPLRDLIIKE